VGSIGANDLKRQGQRQLPHRLRQWNHATRLIDGIACLDGLGFSYFILSYWLLSQCISLALENWPTIALQWRKVPVTGCVGGKLSKSYSSRISNTSPATPYYSIYRPSESFIENSQGEFAALGQKGLLVDLSAVETC